MQRTTRKFSDRKTASNTPRYTFDQVKTMVEEAGLKFAKYVDRYESVNYVVYNEKGYVGIESALKRTVGALSYCSYVVDKGGEKQEYPFLPPFSEFLAQQQA